MPILQEINDPYYASTASTLGGMADGMIGNPAKQQAEAIALANQVQLRRMQQQKLEQEMQLARQKADWEGADRKKMQDAEDAAGRYWGYATPAPVNGTPQDMERYYREQNFRDQTSRLMTRSGKSAEDIAKGFNDYQTGFNAAHPAAVGPQTMPDGSPVPQMPQGLSPEAQKKWNENTGKEVSSLQLDQIASQAAARKKLPELVNMRDSWEAAAAADAIGGFSATSPARWVAGALGTPREVARQNYEGVRATVLNQNSGDHKGEGAVSNYERELYGKPYADVNAASPEVGRTRMADQFALTLRNVGVDPGRAQEIALHITHGAPRAAIDRLVADLQRGNAAGVDQFLEAARVMAQRRMGGGR